MRKPLPDDKGHSPQLSQHHNPPVLWQLKKVGVKRPKHDGGTLHQIGHFIQELLGSFRLRDGTCIRIEGRVGKRLSKGLGGIHPASQQWRSTISGSRKARAPLRSSDAPPTEAAAAQASSQMFFLRISRSI